ncbi:MAG: iron ABC transporter permease [Pseudomonadota bacterium]
MRSRIYRWGMWLLFFIVSVIAISCFSLSVGSSSIPFKNIVVAVLERVPCSEYSIIFNVRLPRILLAFAIGGSLSLAGVILQGMFHNPLVEPYTLGISGGAALGVCLNIVFRLTHSLGVLSLPACGFLGALSIVVLIYSLSVKKGVLKIQGLLLTGVMISFISSSLIMLIMAVSRVEDLHGIVFWIMGSLEEPNNSLILLSLGVSIAGLILSYLFCINLNALALGEEEAMHLGINVEKSKKFLFIIASVLTGFSVSVAGVIGFVGLVIPHYMRMLVGRDHRILLISSFLGGACFLIASDTLARTIIAPVELPVGVITGLVGGSAFVYVLTRQMLLKG